MEAMETLQRDLNDALTEAMGEVNEYVFFTLQRNFYKCAYRCFDEHTTVSRVEPCVQQCGAPPQRAQNIISNELSSFQERIQRSVLVCRDKFDEQRDIAALTEDELARNAKDCVERAVKGHITGIPKLMARIKSQITVKED
ncbi:hypothetical protein SELMODRAFT_416255 [Selaginella moellendorffii]|uniref:Protein FAM136A n=1 Tax=Selaginella moellendorffii TaxID=88036 RepID=D8RYQ2_SELML|nr:protein FAM136A [Selaginella moellendorffii]XP_024537119.1 protein FAM136A [Selaginella moellendorffii]XP_024537120.1 protein FAM136A [Selaginella moellendorffii]XP_024537121.1 protein FAM136A [Selaginella moellendorffii]EFJ22473.1 hypothetical protein SELMODRAFT_416255 [Selaginella moellendorffii]|eukprot:XP_002976213.1 protein FAM136A [Selaginella moellendorffii]